MGVLGSQIAQSLMELRCLMFRTNNEEISGKFVECQHCSLLQDLLSDLLFIYFSSKMTFCPI